MAESREKCSLQSSRVPLNHRGESQADHAPVIWGENQKRVSASRWGWGSYAKKRRGKLACVCVCWLQQCKQVLLYLLKGRDRAPGVEQRRRAPSGTWAANKKNKELREPGRRRTL